MSLGAVFGGGRVPSVACGKLDADNRIDVVVGKEENTGGNEIYFNDSKD
jgi:hypothetical protein